jgi:transcriptional repressor NrdR
VRCPYCGFDDQKVIDSRDAKEGLEIRRRRECIGCKRRFTTYERVEDMMPAIVKKDNRREPFNREKIVTGLRTACKKRPVSMNRLEKIADKIEQSLQERGEREVAAGLIGEMIMRELHGLDEVAYVRFASVYRQFRDIEEFMKEIAVMMKSSRKL